MPIPAVLDGTDEFPIANGDENNEEIISKKIEYGYYGNEGYVIRRNDKYYLLCIDWVKQITDSDEDYYSVSIKY